MCDQPGWGVDASEHSGISVRGRGVGSDRETPARRTGAAYLRGTSLKGMNEVANRVGAWMAQRSGRDASAEGRGAGEITGRDCTKSAQRGQNCTLFAKNARWVGHPHVLLRSSAKAPAAVCGCRMIVFAFVLRPAG